MADIINFKITMTDGKVMNGELYPTLAPISVENFKNLINDKFFDGLIFHRIIPGFVIQGGGYDIDMNQKTTPSIKGEFSSNGWSKNNELSHSVGVLSMARTPESDSATSQFFICVGDCKSLDGQYASFGKLSDEESIKNALAISGVETLFGDQPIKPVVIEKIEIIN